MASARSDGRWLQSTPSLALHLAEQVIAGSLCPGSLQTGVLILQAHRPDASR